MRLVIDLQGAQGDQGEGDIGYLAQTLTAAMIRAAGRHDPLILLNEALEDSAETLGDAFARLLPRRNIRFWRGLRDCAAGAGEEALARRQASEMIRAQVLAGLDAELVLVTNLIDGARSDAASAWPAPWRQAVPTTALFHDADPPLYGARYLPADLAERGLRGWYLRQLQELRRCEGLLAISARSRLHAENRLGYPAERIFDIRAGADLRLFPVGEAGRMRSADALARYGVAEGFVLCPEPEAVEGRGVAFLRAYALLPEALRARHPLAIANARRPGAWRRAAARLGLEAPHILPPIPQSGMAPLHAACHAYVMLSPLGSFAFPALRAMAEGAPALFATAPGMPGPASAGDATFNIEDPADTARALTRLLTDTAYRESRIRQGLRQARQFDEAESARLAWAGLEETLARRAPPSATISAPAPLVRRKPSMAFVSPLPPDQTGIADYAGEVLPDFGRYYDVTLVCQSGETEDEMLRALFPILTEEAFLEGGQEFDRILYQVGNSQFHTRMVAEMLPRRPGIVVQHDAHLGNMPLLRYLQGGSVDSLAGELLSLHGWPAVRMLAEQGAGAATAAYVCSAPVFQHAVGVIHHSRHAMDITLRALGAEAAPLLHYVPLPRAHQPARAREEARRALDLPTSAKLFVSFGLMAETKRPLEVARCWIAAMRGEAQALLAFVGVINTELAEAVRAEARAAGMEGQVIFTDRVSREEYFHWLAAADMALQFRRNSRGETSAAVADTLMAGIPTVVNAHGTVVELPPDILLMLPDAVEQDIAGAGQAIAALWKDAERRRLMGEKARRWALEALSPATISGLYHEAVERAYRGGGAAARRAALREQMDAAAPEAEGALEASFPQPWPSRLLIDASAMWHNDLGTGIQRVIRELARRLLPAPAGQHMAEMVRLDGERLRSARPFAARILGLPAYEMADEPLSPGEGDLLLLADNYGIINEREIAALRQARRRGARIVAIIYDILPLQRPDWFPDAMVPALRHWLLTVLEVADAVMCISRSVAEELRDWLDTSALRRQQPLEIGWFHLGADFAVGKAAPLPENAETPAAAALQAAAARPSLLMVGTVEPRKGHAAALDALEALWAQGLEIGLTIVGKPGWKVEPLLERLRHHPEAGHRLHWIGGVDDAGLQALYRSHASLLMASEGEGFGLPIIEAAQAGLPVVARDIPVFREICGDHALWFGEGRPLEEVLRDWLARQAAGRLPSPAGITALNWDDSAGQVRAQLESGSWPMRWTPPPRD